MPQVDREATPKARDRLPPVQGAFEPATLTRLTDHRRLLWLDRWGQLAGELRQVRCLVDPLDGNTARTLGQWADGQLAARVLEPQTRDSRVSGRSVMLSTS